MAAGSVAGPLLSTAAWVVSSLRQADHPAAGVQLSGLAALDAGDPQFMMAAFVVLGACSIGFGAALRRVAGHRPAGPWRSWRPGRRPSPRERSSVTTCC